jgi:hypothetical protein
LNQGAADATSAGTAPPLQRTKSLEMKNGKWVSPVMAGVAGVSSTFLFPVLMT